MYPVKTTLIILLAFIFFVPAYEAKAADTLKIKLTYKHKISENNQMQGYSTIAQQFYTPDDTLFREIRYDEFSGQISGYTFYFYKNGLLSSEENYHSNDEISFIVKYEYDQNGNEVQSERITFDEMKLAVTETTQKIFNANHKLIRQKESVNRKVTATFKFSYDDEGQLIQLHKKFRPVYDTTIQSETMDYILDDRNNRVKQVNIYGKNIQNQKYERKEIYEYNDQGWLTAIRSYDKTGALTGEKIYKYLLSGTISIYQENDGEGKILLLLQYDYKKHYMEKGRQESVL